MGSTGLTSLLVWLSLAGTAGAQLSDPATRDRSRPALVLSNLGEHGVPPLVTALRHSNPEVRRYAAWALGQSSAGSAAVRELAALLGDPVVAVRNEAADALANIGRPAADALRAARKSTDPIIRAAALRAFGSAGPARRGGVSLPDDYKARSLRPVGEPSFVGPDLSDSLRDPDTVVRWAAIEYLTRVAAGRQLADVKADALPGLKEMLFDTNAELRASADRFLSQLSEKPSQLRQQRFEQLQPRLTAEYAEFTTAFARPSSGASSVAAVALIHESRRAAVRAFAVAFQFRPDRTAKIPQLKPVLDAAVAADPVTAHIVAYQLVGELDDPRLAELMLAGLSSTDAGIRAEAATALARLHTPGPKVPVEVLTKLREIAEDPVAQVREAVFVTRLQLLPAGDEKKAAILARTRDSHARIRTGAFQATPALGSAVLPDLEKLLADPDPELRRLALMFLIAVVQTPPGVAPAQVVRAADVVFGAFDDPNDAVRALAIERFGGLRASRYDLLGPHALPALHDQVFAKLSEIVRADSNKVVRVRAIYSLAAFGERAGAVLVPLLDDPVTRDTIASVAPRLGKHGAACIPSLRAMLKGTPSQRTAAILALGALGPRAKDALPDLLPLAADELAQSNGIVNALVAIEPSGERTIPAVLKVIEGMPVTAFKREALLASLAPYGPKAAAAVPLLKEQMTSAVTIRTIELAVAIGPKAEPVVPLLVAALKDTNPRKTVWDEDVARALTAIGAKSDAALKALRDKLPGVNNRPNVAVAVALVSLADDKDGATVLAKALEPKSDLCGWALDEIGRFPAMRTKYAPVLRTLADTDGPNRLSATRELIALGEGKRCVPYLTAQVKEKGYGFGLEIRLLQQIGPDAAEALPVLEALLLRVRSESDARAITQAIAAISPPKK